MLTLAAGSDMQGCRRGSHGATRCSRCRAALNQLYAALRDQLPADFTCYHGIEWLHLGGRAQEGDSDFLIAHAELRVLVLGAGTAVHARAHARAGAPAQEVMPSLGCGVAFPKREYREQAHPNAPLDLSSTTGPWASSPRASRS